MRHRFERRASAVVFAALALLLVGACGGDDAGGSDASCTDATLRYESFGKPFVTSYCASCHGATVTGASRLGAPAGEVFDTRALIAAKTDELKVQVVEMKAMPFGNSTPKPSDAERVKFGQWLDCGAPE